MMTQKMTWLDEPWSMRVDYSDVLSVDDIQEVMRVCMLRVQKHPINILVDFQEVEKWEPATMKNPTILQVLKHPNMKWVAFVGAKGLLALGLGAFGRYVSVKKFADIEEGQAFIEEMVKNQKQMQDSEAAQP
jgi:hypothetical protein